MQSGNLIVTGENFTSIMLSGRPREVVVRFKDEEEFERRHHPCNPHHKDFLAYEVVREDETLAEHHRLEHHHHDRLFFLLIKWRVEGVREIDWIVMY
jgi:hypothetical protein